MMQIWLKQGKESLRLPVLPVNFDASIAQQNTTANVSSLGEVNLIGKRGLKTLPISSFFPKKSMDLFNIKVFPIRMNA